MSTSGAVQGVQGVHGGKGGGELIEGAKLHASAWADFNEQLRVYHHTIFSSYSWSCFTIDHFITRHWSSQSTVIVEQPWILYTKQMHYIYMDIIISCSYTGIVMKL